ncbi:ATP-binding cassette domain-containing protein [bacterium]|nr:ATP-binding cassette domain-containing protein [bacterium]
MVNSPVVTLDHVSSRYPGGPQVLHDLSLTIPSGSLTAIIGENGSGKSTLVKCILGLQPYTGTIVRPAAVGYLSQNKAIDPHFPANVTQIVRSGVITLPKFRFSTAKTSFAQADALMRKLRLDQLARRPWSALSAGQQQRVLLARALCATQELLVLDEPTTGLDPRVAHDIYALLRQLRRHVGLSVLMVTHDWPQMLDQCDYVIQLVDGRLNFAGTQDKFRPSARKEPC